MSSGTPQLYQDLLLQIRPIRRLQGVDASNPTYDVAMGREPIAEPYVRVHLSSAVVASPAILTLQIAGAPARTSSPPDLILVVNEGHLCSLPIHPMNAATRAAVSFRIIGRLGIRQRFADVGPCPPGRIMRRASGMSRSIVCTPDGDIAIADQHQRSRAQRFLDLHPARHESHAYGGIFVMHRSELDGIKR